MTTEELLKKRFKVTLDYPNSIYTVGQILQQHGQEYFNTAFFEKYPYIFKELRWHEERAPEDMPKFVRYSEYYLNHYHLDGEFKNMIFKVDNWSNGHYGIKAKGGGIIHGYEINFEPADESEYNAFINQKQQ